tara:strand:- start:240 stop:521 length:282 start_codon:yes stop_codon:yes gene_type:complete
MPKKKMLYYCLLAEEGIAYYLTFKWPLIIFACIISLFPTIMVWWSLKILLNFGMDWELIFFFIWLIIMIIFVLEFPLPMNIKEKVKEKSEEIW